MQCLFHGQVEHVVDVLAVIADLQHLRLVARALALLADELDIGQELHLDGDGAIALADFAAAAGDVEGKMPGSVAALLALGQAAKSSRMASKALM